MPDWKAEVHTRLASLHLSPAREAEIVDELSQHLDDRYRESDRRRRFTGGRDAPGPRRLPERQRAGTTDGVAAAGARLAADHAGAPTGHVFSDVWQDLRYATRTFRKQPGFAATAVLTLALGIGATTAIFSVVYGVLLKPLPFQDPERLVSLLHRGPGANLETMNQGPATYLTYLDNQQTFEAIGAWDANQVSVTGRGDPEQLEALSVTDTTLSLLRVPPHLGRLINAGDTAPGSPLRVVLTYGYWQRRFGGAENGIGQSLQVDGTAGVIIGVLPSSFKFLRSNPALLLPMQLDPATAFRGINFDRQALARLKPGVSLEQASADIARMIPLLPRPYEILKLEPKLRPLAADVVGDIGRILWILLAAVGAVLLIACGNVANLFLIRAEGRQRELRCARRSAPVGASRPGAAVRKRLAGPCRRRSGAGARGSRARFIEKSCSSRTPPGRRNRHRPHGAALRRSDLCAERYVVRSGCRREVRGAERPGAKEGGRSSSDGPARHRTRNALVVSQVALALTLLVGSGLMIRTFVAMRLVAPGFVQTGGDPDIPRRHTAASHHR